MVRCLKVCVVVIILCQPVWGKIGESKMGQEEMAIGGVGGVYFLAEPGELRIEIWKRDLNTRNNPTNLRAILLGPDRENLGEAVLLDDGKGKGSGPGGPSAATLTTQVDQTGIFALNVTVTHDRYGENIRWGFSTNCERYLIETSGGHKDARHLEPIVLDSPGTAGDICFTARTGPIEIELGDLPEGTASPSLFDSQGDHVADLEVASGQIASYTIPAGDRTDSPWRLHFPQAVATVHIDGVTRWESGERLENLSLWSPTVESFFSLPALRWMLAPYSHAFHAAASTTHTVDFRLHNNSDHTDTLNVTVSGTDMDVQLSLSAVSLEAGATATLQATIAIPDDAQTGDVLTSRITTTSTNHPEITTWSTLEARIGQADQLTLDGPMVYRAYEHENEQFAYTPDYPNENQIYFAPDNRPFIRVDDGLRRLGRGGGEFTDTVEGERFRAVSTKVAFGENGEVCLLGRSLEGIAYLYSTDGGSTFTATPAPDRDASRQQWDIEQFAGQNTPRGPAPFVRATETGEYDPSRFWRHVNDLELFLPEIVNGSLVIGDPILLSTQAIGISSHSGIPSAVVSRGHRVHIVWGEATDPDGDEPGVPAYVATYDRDEGRLLGESVFIGFGPPANDVHNTPSIAIDSEGYLHTLTGTHGQPFVYAKSLEPDTAHGGFTVPERVEEELRSTYIGLVCDPDDTLHLVFRTWKSDGEYHPESHYANLAYKRKMKDGVWEPMKRLAIAPFTEYSIWYHRLTIDREGRLFVSFDYWSTFWFYRMDHFGNTPGRGRGGGSGRRKTIMSADGGNTWKLLETSDL